MKKNGSSSTIAWVIFASAILLNISPALAARVKPTATLNGAATITIPSSANIALAITDTTTGTGNAAHWESTGWQISQTEGAFACINTPAHTTAGTYTATSTITAPSAAGTYNVYLITYTNTNCTDIGTTNPSPVLTLKNAVIVKATAVPPAPALTINPPALSSGTVGVAYSQTLTASTTATGTFIWSITSGTLPAGLALGISKTTTAIISGTPTIAGTSTFGIKAANGSSSSTQNYILSIANSVATTTPPAPSSTNLIVNPQLTADTIASGTPDDWNQGGWGTNTATFNYPVAGVSGGVGANVTINSFTSGDAKWYFNNVSVTPGANYTFSDSYNSNIQSQLTIQFTSTNGTLSYLNLATLNATNGVWATTTQTITAPTDAVAMTVFHLIAGVGSLTTTNYSLTSANEPADLFPEGLVSLTFDDGWESQYDNALPILQSANMHGSFYIISDGMLNALETIFPSDDNPFAVTTTTKATTWPDIYTDPTQHSFTFSDTYTASVTSTITVSYKISGGGGASSTVLGPFPAGTNVNTTSSFALPALNGPLTIVQAVTGSGTLTATNPLLIQPVGYMDTNHVLGLQAAGEEIGDHTVNHCDLVAVFNSATTTASCAVMPPDSTTVQFQVDQARTDLQNAGFSPVDTFAYPYGDGAGNANIETIIKADGIISARSVNSGYNTKLTDPYSLFTQSVDTTVPNFATVQHWIDYAATNHVWLILTFHQIELSTSTIQQNGETDATTAAMLQQIVNYLATQRTAGKITVDTVHNIMTQYMP